MGPPKVGPKEGTGNADAVWPCLVAGPRHRTLLHGSPPSPAPAVDLLPDRAQSAGEALRASPQGS